LEAQRQPFSPATFGKQPGDSRGLREVRHKQAQCGKKWAPVLAMDCGPSIVFEPTGRQAERFVIIEHAGNYEASTTPRVIED